MSSVMDVQELFKKLRKEAEYPVCLETVKGPKTLPCLHSFCFHCLDKLAGFARRQLQTTIKCPVCLSRFQIPQGDTFNELPTSFHLNRLVDILALKDRSEGVQSCSSCDENNAVTCYCFVCQSFMCSGCFDAHQRLKATRSHRNVLIENLQARDVGELFRRPEMCSEKYHENEALEYYCQECKRCICMTCGFVSHNGHDMIDIQHAAEQRKKQIMSIRDKAKAKVVNIELKIDSQVGLMSKSTTEMLVAQGKVTKTVDELVRVLREHEKATKEKLAEINEMQIRHNSPTLENFQLIVSQIKRSVEYGEGILQRNIAHEILQAENTIIGPLAQLLNVPEIETSKDLHFSYIPNEEIIHAIKGTGLGQAVVGVTDPSRSVVTGNGLNKAKLGSETYFTVTTKDSNGNQCYNEQDQVFTKIFSPTGEEEVAIMNHRNGDYKVCYTPKHFGQHDIVVKVNGMLVAARPWRFQVQRPIYHLKATFSSWSSTTQAKKGNLKFPCSIAQSVKDGNIAVADYKRKQVLLFDSELQNVKTILNFEKSKPRSVAFTNFFELVVVHEASSDSSSMSVFTENGQFVKRIDKHLINPCNVSVRNDGKLIVCDGGDIKVKILSPDGAELLKHFTVPKYDAFPWFAVYHQGKYFVSFRMASCVKVFNEEGVSLFDIGIYSCAPAGLAIDKFDNLIVCDNGNNRVQVFTLGGKFLCLIHEFPRYNSPCSVIVTKDGDVMVSDVEGKAIHVFQKYV